MTNSISWNKGGIIGTFLLFKKVFSMNQYGFEFLWTLSSLFANLKWQLCFEPSIAHFKRLYRDFAETVLLRRIFYDLIFSWINNFILVLNHSGSLPSHTINSWGMKLLRIFKTVLLKFKTLSSTFLFSKALSQLNWLITLPIRSSF